MLLLVTEAAMPVPAVLGPIHDAAISSETNEWSVHPTDIKALNMEVTENWLFKAMNPKLTEPKGSIDKRTFAIKDFNSLYSVTHRISVSKSVRLYQTELTKSIKLIPLTFMEATSNNYRKYFFFKWHQ